MSRRILNSIAGVVLPIGLVALWWFTSRDSSSPYFPPLTSIVEAFFETWTAERLESDLLPSLVSVAAGFAIAIAVGVSGGVALGLSARARRDLRPVTEFFRAMPVAALVPIGLVALGPGARMEIALVAFAATWPVLVATADGVRAADHVMLDTARVFGVSPARRLVRVVIPGALPHVMAGVRISIAAAVATMIVANMLGSSSGLGHLVISAQQSFNILETWAGLLMIGLVGCALTSLVVMVEAVTLSWHRQSRATSDVAA